MPSAPSSLRTMLITCTTALIVALLTLTQMTPAAQAGRTRSGAGKLRPKQEALIELGRRLFFEPLVSRSGTRSCASCHDPEHGFSDPSRVSEDDFGTTRRHSQTLLDTARNPTAHWDGEFETVEELVLARVGALRGRKGKLGHGATLLDVVQEADEEDAQASTPIDGEEATGGSLDEETSGGEEEGLIEEGEGGGGGGGEGGYGGAPTARSASSASAPKKPTKDGAASVSQPRDGASPKKSEASAKKATPKKAAPKKPAADNKGADDKKEAGKKADADTVRRPTEEERKAKAAALRTELRRLPLAEHVLESSGRYAEAFQAAFGSPSVSSARIARAIAAYCDTIVSTPSPYDRFAAGDSAALSLSARRGLALFRGPAQCATCHDMSGRTPAFTDFAFHNTGVVWSQLGLRGRRAALRGDEVFRRTKDELEAPRRIDEGRARISTRKTHLRAFKTPTLRDVTRRGPYMHDGRFATLEAVVRYYAKGGSPDPARAGHVVPFAASEQDVADLVAFLTSLTGETRPGMPGRTWARRAEETRLRFVDADGAPLAGLPVTLTPAGDWATPIPGTQSSPLQRRTDAKGWVVFSPGSFVHARITLPDGLVPEGGTLVPDTCEKATVTVPVRGRTSVLLRLPSGQQPPAQVVAEHTGTFVLPGHATPRTLLQRRHVLPAGNTQLVRYDGWMRTDVPATVRVLVPGRQAGLAATLHADEVIRLDGTRD